MNINNSKILIVEDEEDYSDLYQIALADYSPNVHIARSYDEGLKLVKQYCYQVAIFDKRLVDAEENNTEGIRILEKVFSTQEGTGLILATGYPTDDVLKAAYENFHIIGYINKKSYDREELLKYIQKGIAQSNDQIKKLKEKSLTKEKLFHLFLPIQSDDPFLSSHLENKSGVSLLTTTLDHLFPLCYSDKLGITFIDGKFTIIQTVIWSRSVGKPIKILFGHRKALAGVADKLENENIKFTLSTKDGISVLTYVPENYPPSDFPNYLWEKN